METRYELPSDCRGDGFDVAVAVHTDDQPCGITQRPDGTLVHRTRVYASGAFCGYRVTETASDERLRIVTEPRGTWRWQDAFSVSIYRPGTLKDGRRVWRFAGKLVGKSSEPQLRRAGLSGLPYGTLHNKPLEEIR